MGKKQCQRPKVDAENMHLSYIPNGMYSLSYIPTIQNVNLKDLVNAMYSVTRLTAGPKPAGPKSWPGMWSPHNLQPNKGLHTDENNSRT